MYLSLFQTRPQVASSMTQPTPSVTEADVERIVRRDFPPEQFQTVMSILDEYGHEKWMREKPRVQLAVLKLASGNLQTLRREMETAKCDYRDVLSPAEYPLYSKKWSRMKSLSEEEKQQIIDSDWQQYDRWLKG
jgi:hypothetical protein